MILYVTGMHGSGTSLTSQYLHHCGVNMMGRDQMDHLGEHKIFRKVSHQILRALSEGIFQPESWPLIWRIKRVTSCS